jgi:hypothetical protein
MSAVQVADLADRVSVDEQYVGGLWDTVFRNEDSLIGRIIPLKGYKAGTYCRVNPITAANGSVETYVENQSAPARGKQTVITSKFAFKHFRGMIGETGHARRERGPSNQGLRDGSSPDFELEYVMKDIRDKMTTTFMTAGQTYSVDGIIDDDGTNYGDVSRATYTSLKSYKLSASSAAISTALINQANWRSREAPYGAKPELWFASPLQVGKLAEVLSGKVAPFNAAGGLSDVIPERVGVIEVPDLTTSLIFAMTDVARTWGYTSNEVGNMAGGGMGFHARYYGSQDDSDTLQISTAGAIWCTQPQRQIRIEGLSTG